MRQVLRDRPLAPEVMAGQSPQFVIDNRHEIVESLPVSVAPAFQQFRD